MRLGVDFGTTNSAIAFYDGQQLQTVIVDPANNNPYVMPSLIYIDRTFEATVGSQAASAYLEHETGRPVRWRQRDAGEIEVTVASVGSAGGDPIEFVQQVSVLVDEAANGRLIQSIKTALFNDRYEGTQVFGKFFRIEDLIAIVLRRLRQTAERETGEASNQIVLGRPAEFSPNPLVDSRSEAVLLKAAHLAGFTEVSFALEPVAVAYLHHRSSRTKQTVLVFDFGGGTLDLTIAEVGGTQPPAILAVGGAAIGGNDLDRRIMASLLPHFGGGDEGILPADMSDKLLAWQTMPELSRPHYLEHVHRLRRGGHRQTMRALETLITSNIGFRLFKEIEQVKQQLSETDTATLTFDYDAIQIRETISRRRFDRMISSDLAAIRASVFRLLESASLRPDQIDVVLRTGGSSLIPAVRDMLEEIFGQQRVQAIDPLVSVTGGFAIMAHDNNRWAVRPAPEELITEIDPPSYSTHNICIGAPAYTDRAFVVNRIPPALHGLAAIQPANNDYAVAANHHLRFCLKRAARVYVAYENSVQRIPAWLREFEPENMRIEIEDEFALIRRTMQLYGKDYPPGLVVMGGNQAEGYEGEAVTNYFIIIRPDHS